MLRSKWARALVIASLAGLTLTVSASSGAAKSGPATLRLVSVLPQVSADRFKGDTHLYFSPGVYVAAVAGDFEVDALRGPDGSITLWQVSRDSHGVHPIREITPARPISNLGNGLPGFFQLTIKNGAGAVVTHRSLPFCLSTGYGQARVDPAGPSQPRYPYDCGTNLTKAAVWGLDDGWATALNLSMRFGAPDGLYNLTVAIAPTYVQQFGIAQSEASASLTLKVRTGGGGGCGVRRPCPRPPIFDASALAQGQPLGEGPRSRALAASDAALGPQVDGKPDMASLPAHDLSISHDRRNNRDYLSFGATIWNAGSGPLVVEGFRDGANPVMNAVQYIYQNGVPTSSEQVGQFEFDTRRGHHHWHMEDIAEYDLLDHSGNRVVLSSKQSFCLAPTDGIDLTLPGADWRPDQAGLWSACAGDDSIWLREVLPAGWGDTYFQSVAGQSFNITSLPNGHYKIRVTTDPEHNLIETNYDNNVGLLDITLGGKLGHRTVRIDS
ncbi:MAG: hypothetical protein QOJ34_714 [Pseudonocardiales bacterium]|jgi:hypothetical protein|nr:hypothetical protein [Pseudonocardiales bacterium]